MDLTIMEALKETLLTVLSFLLMLAVNAFKKWLEENKNNKAVQTVKETLQANEAIVKIVVAAVEQTVTELHGAEKAQAAKEQVIALLNAKGLAFTEAEIDVLIEKAVGELNKLKAE